MEDLETIKSLILQNVHPAYTTTNNREVRVRCPYCGDSKKNPMSAHMYIELHPPFRFHCFKCETSGVLNSEALRDLGIYNTDLSIALINANKTYKQYAGVQQMSFKRRVLKNTPIDSDLSANSVAYFNSRYKSSFSNADLTTKFKVVTDAYAFFRENSINPPKDQYEFDKSIGFISADSSHIIFRDISNTQEKRYYNLNLIGDFGIGSISKTYTISNEVDTMKDEMTLVISEGIFDIIGVYTHFYNGTSEDNTIFAAACGKAYNAVILNYIHLGFLNLNIVIYSDADVDISFYKRLKEDSPYLKFSKITIYYNSLYNSETGYGKDYGVPADEIQLRKVII